MGHLGFSYVGVIYLLMLFIPNIIWSKNQPAGYDSENENKIFIMFERIGQVLVSCMVLIFRDFNIHTFSIWSIWFIVSFIFMLLYEYWWVRYFKSSKTLKDFYSPLFGIPVAGATLPILGFLFLGIYGKVIWLIISTIILGIGHIGIHLKHLKELQ